MNKEELTLVILAAGMGSRFGGLKQVAPLGPNGEFIIDYSVYDAIQAGFNKIVFLIKEENYELFQETIGKRISKEVEVVYAFQKHDEFIAQYPSLKDRQKPLGTAHALWCCKDVVTTPFAMINADDFYGRDAFEEAAKFLRTKKDNTVEQYGMIAYSVKNTLTENGAVKRGACEVQDGKLVRIVESSIERKDGQIVATPLDGSSSFTLLEDAPVSMNFLLFHPSIFDFITAKLKIYLEQHQEDLTKDEFLIPDVLFEAIEEGFATVQVLQTTATWYGVTYKEDSAAVQNAIQAMADQGIYPQKLWKS